MSQTDSGPKGGEPRWALGWYKTKRHVVNEAAPAGATVSAICSRYTGLYPEGRGTRGDQRYAVPAADTAETMALPACKLCLRLLGNDTAARP